MKLDIELLMAIQYSLPLSTTPLEDLADAIGRSFDEVARTLRFYASGGVLKRYGVNLNYRAFPRYRQAALVGLRCRDVAAAARVINEFDEVRVKHNFLRDAQYNVWFTVKGRNVGEIGKLVASIAAKLGVEDYIVLPTKKIYRMDVKYDLTKGVSWSRIKREPENVPLITDLGFDEEIVRKLESLPIERRPFRIEGYAEEELVSLAEELIKLGIGRDFSGVLRERGIGFAENGMVVLSVENAERVANRLLEYPQITHLIERIACERWNYPLYFMVHARSREPIEEMASEVASLSGVRDVRVVYSRANLREL